MAQTDSIRTLPRIGPKRAELFARLGIETLGDLLHFYPRAYEDRTQLLPIASLEVDQPACFIASVVTTPQTHRIPKPGQRALEVTKLTVADRAAPSDLFQRRLLRRKTGARRNLLLLRYADRRLSRLRNDESPL